MTGETMPRRPRRNHTPTFKAKVALAAINGEKTMVELVLEFDVHANQIKQWKDQLLEGVTGIFGAEARVEDQVPAIDVKTLHAKIGQLTLENDFYPERSPRPEFWGAQKDDRQEPCAVRREAGRALETKPWQRLLSASGHVTR